MKENSQIITNFKTTEAEKTEIKATADSMGLSVTEFLKYCITKEKETRNTLKLIQDQINATYEKQFHNYCDFLKNFDENFVKRSAELADLHDQLIRYKISADLIEKINNSVKEMVKAKNDVTESNDAIDLTFKNLNSSIINMTRKLDGLNKFNQ